LAVGARPVSATGLDHSGSRRRACPQAVTLAELAADPPIVCFLDRGPRGEGKLTPSVFSKVPARPVPI